MKNALLSLLVLCLLGITSLYAEDPKGPITPLNASQVSKLDLSGKWVGKRKQHTADKRSYIEIFEYEFDLKQEGNLITGTSTILNANGEYAEMKIQGVIVGDKLHFREYEVKDAIRPEGRVWCFKSGELRIGRNGDRLVLFGATPSFMEIYNYPCTGGYTEIVKADNSNNLNAFQSEFSSENLVIDEQIGFNVFPNPYIDNTTIYYSVKNDSKVTVEIFDLNGRLVSNLFSGEQKAGGYQLIFNAKSSGYMSSTLIVKLTIGEDVYSRQIVQFQ
ncbi:MAG: T9SS type A sorting domain-containing protein [Chitinophagales bacterium]|nr:T9SS type A sorting domain-containing protein [Chitinophagales bacterium]MDW8418903.1 T9SS type A sorting domain-containing protein [Chitinophagales bacterium]